MPSILPDFEYDIFISYRQNDNKRDSWVTNFVEALQDELEATLKNPVSIYFDENPHDGLLEIHQVNASLENKLKCIVLIPIISQTYCDEKGYAWTKEFLSFLEMANSDDLGMNIKLPNGNVVSRVLPIRIHDLDFEDKQLLETKLNGPLRAIDFIYKEPGVNRPLKPQDKRELNQEKTSYQNQMNKVANALKDIGQAVLRTTQPQEESSRSQERSPRVKKNPLSRKLKFAIAFGAVAIILLLSYSFFGDFIASEPTNKSIAVLPFRNDSDDPDNIYFCNGLMEDIINQLSKIPDMRVPSATSMIFYRENPKPYSEIIKDLNVSYLLEASIRKTGNRAIMNITLIDAEQNKQIWTERMEMDLTVKDLFDIQYEVASKVANKMRIAIEDNIAIVPTDNYQAYDHYLRARDLLRIWDVEYNKRAITALYNAIKLDGNFIDAIALLGQAYGQRAELGYGGAWLDSTRYYSTIAYEKDKKNASAINAYAYAHILEGDPGEALRLYLDAYKLKSNDTYNYAGWCYYQLGQFDKAIEWAKINIDLDPQNSIYYVDLVNATNTLELYDYTLQYTEEAFQINPVFTFVNDNLIEMETSNGNYTAAIGYMNKNFEIRPDSIWIANQGPLYYKLGEYEKAEKAMQGEFLNLGLEDNIDENSRLEIYTVLQYRALVKMKLGNKAEALEELSLLAKQMEEDMNDARANKYFSLAGCYAVLGDHDLSIEYLRKAEKIGFNRYVDYIQNDLLDPIRNNVEFIALLASVKERNDAMRERVLSNGYLED